MKDKGLERELDQAGIPSAGNRPFMLPGETARDLGQVCYDCSNPRVVYLIAAPMGDLFPVGAYCYKHLLERCRRAKMIPYPMPVKILDLLQADLKITPDTKKIFIDGGMKDVHL